MTACNWTDKKSDWNDWTNLKRKRVDKKASFDSLTTWLITNRDTIRPTFLQADKLPTDKRELMDSLGVRTILLENYFCSMTDTRGGMRITYEFNKNQEDEIYSYLMYARCMTSDLEDNIEKNGTYINVDDKWYLIQKNYDWFKE
ncbi:MAG: hypothetical protein ACKO96_35315 [Flammeovirgaceae bacterium]